MSLFIYDSVDELVQNMADDFIKKVDTVINKSGECNLILSGGNSPKRLYELLASYPYKAELDWDKIYFFFADERCVPFDDPANNGLMVKKALFEPLKIADSRIFYISTLRNPEDAAKKYSKRDTSAVYGKYLANSVANCRGCHTNRDLMTGAFIGEDYAGGLKFDMETDSGVYSLTTPNLTPGAGSRIKGWTKEQFIQRFRMGRLIPQTHMPWGPFSRMNDDDLAAIYNFLQTVKPVQNTVPHGLVKEK